MTLLKFLVLFVSLSATISANCWVDDEVFNFHFHPLWFQTNKESERNAMALRQKLYTLTKSGELKHCSVTCSVTCDVNKGPLAEYPIGNFGMCCNMSSAADALAFLSKNRGDLSIFVHPTTLHPLLDHSKRGIWLGPSMPFDLSSTPTVRDPPRICN